MNKLLLIDGHNLLFQMFYGMPHHFYSKDNKPIWAIFGFVGAIIKMINLINPTHLVVIFDGEHDNERNELLIEYKSNRVDYSNLSIEESPFAQLDDIYNALKILNIKYYETKKVEADDIIAGYVNIYNDLNIIIASNDTDFCQLVNKNVNILKYKGKNSIVLTEEDIFAKFGVHPYQYAYFKALVGDNADVIRGVDGIGPKTASKLLLEYDDLFNILDNVNNIKIGKRIEENKDRIILNYKLIKLDYNDKLPFILDELVYIKTNFSTKDIMIRLNLM